MKKSIELPLMNVRDTVLFPETDYSLYIGRDFTIAAIQSAKKYHHGKIIVVAQKSIQKERSLSNRDIYKIGTLCSIQKSIMTADGTIKVLLRGEQIVSINSVYESEQVRFSSALVINSKAPRQKLSEQEKQEILTLLLKWKPRFALDDTDNTFQYLKSETNRSNFISKVSGLLTLPLNQTDIASIKKRGIGINPKNSKLFKSFADSNRRVKHRQLLLEQRSPEKRLTMIREILSSEIHSGAF